MTKEEFMKLKHEDTIQVDDVTYIVTKAPDDVPPFRSQRRDEIELKEVSAKNREPWEVVDCWTPGRWGGAKLILPEPDAESLRGILDKS